MKYRVFATDRTTGHDHDFDVEARSPKQAADAAFDNGWLVRKVMLVHGQHQKKAGWVPSGRSIVFWVALFVWTGIFVWWVVAIGTSDIAE